MTFEQLKIIEPILRAVKSEGYTVPTPIQEQAIPVLLEKRDILGSAQTGTGKTAAFAIPILQQLSQTATQNKVFRPIRALVLAPTRELAAQIGDSFIAYGKNLNIKTAVIFGGVAQRPQTTALNNGVDVLVATPGRLLDLINQKFVKLNQLEYFVLDEADRMLDMGFILDVNKIVRYIPENRQTMLFSATMPLEIVKLANSILHNPVRIAVAPEELTLDVIQQSVYHVGKKEKINLLIDILKDKEVESALVFSRTKHGANKITKILLQAGLKADAIHGDKSQSAREHALHQFKSKKIQALIATDIAARGIDIEELSHVINFDLPEMPETYIHRIGRTGRAGLGGRALSFCSEDELDLLFAIERHIEKKIEVAHHDITHAYELNIPTPKMSQKPSYSKPKSNPIKKQLFSDNKPKTSFNIGGKTITAVVYENNETPPSESKPNPKANTTHRKPSYRSKTYKRK